jgi:ornithine cyclodeaminase/alanine dehydrogenase-like protein (mu-crystallin family)
VVVKHCKPRTCETFGIIGAGVQGRTHSLLIKTVAPEIRRIVVTDVKSEAFQQFKQDLGRKVDAEICWASTPEEVARQSDILLTATQRLEKPVVRLEWIRKGVLGIALEASRAWEGKAILSADKYVTDDWELTKSYHAQGAFPDGLPAHYTILGKIVAGFEKGRENADDFILAICEGMATTDIALAKVVYEIAEQKNIGSVLTLMERDSVF